MTMKQIQKRLAGMTQAERAELARRIGLSFSVVQKYAIGYRANPTLRTFLKLEKALSD